LGSTMYAADNMGHLSGPTWLPSELKNVTAQCDRSGSDDDLNWLYPDYVKNFGSYVCPGTQNSIRSTLADKPGFSGQKVVTDLANNASSPKANGTSYEVFGTFKGIKKTESSVNSYVIEKYTAALGTHPGASQVFLLTDADDTSSLVDSNDVNNWPDSSTDNHGSEGANFTFCDGHSEFVKQRRFDHVWNIGQDSNVNHLN
jgi:prepilin-type processing-associated H-X9-DG protein